MGRVSAIDIQCMYSAAEHIGCRDVQWSLEVVLGEGVSADAEERLDEHPLCSRKGRCNIVVC